MKPLTTSKWFLALACGSLAVSSAVAQLAPGNPTYDPFSDATAAGGTSYTAGDNLAGQTSASYAAYLNSISGTGQQWWERPGPGAGGTQPTVASAALSFPGLATSGGGSASFGPDGNSALMNLTTGSGGVTPGVSETVYYSYVMQLTDLGGLSLSGVGLTGGTQVQGTAGNDPPALSWASVVMVRSDGAGGFNVGLDGGGKGATSATVAWDATGYNVGDTLFLVGAYNFSDTANGFANGDGQLWINPDPSTFGSGSAPTETLLSGGNSTALARIASVVLEQPTDGPSGQLDDLRVGLSWADVTPAAIPEPSVVALLASALLGLWLSRFRQRKAS